MHFGAQSRSLRAPCERFAPWVTPGPRITRFRLAADLGRMGLDTHRVSNKVSKITSRHLVPLDRASPGTRVGARLGHYAVTAKIGEGGMGEVYRARDTKLDRHIRGAVFSALSAVAFLPGIASFLRHPSRDTRLRLLPAWFHIQNLL